MTDIFLMLLFYFIVSSVVCGVQTLHSMLQSLLYQITTFLVKSFRVQESLFVLYFNAYTNYVPPDSLKQHLILFYYWVLFYFSGPDVPGEGEHKVMDMIRSFSEKVSHCILLVSTTVSQYACLVTFCIM